MYRIIFTKQAAKDAKKLKSFGLDKKAKELIEVMKENPFQKPPAYAKLVGSIPIFKIGGGTDYAGTGQIKKEKRAI